MTPARFSTREARRSDADAIALAHRDSIRSIGPAFYPPQVVDDWAAGISRNLYLDAMEAGEVFFIATGEGPEVLGFSSDYPRGRVRRGRPWRDPLALGTADCLRVHAEGFVTFDVVRSGSAALSRRMEVLN